MTDFQGQKNRNITDFKVQENRDKTDFQGQENRNIKDFQGQENRNITDFQGQERGFSKMCKFACCKQLFSYQYFWKIHPWPVPYLYFSLPGYFF